MGEIGLEIGQEEEEHGAPGVGQQRAEQGYKGRGWPGSRCSGPPAPGIRAAGRATKRG